jgi:hypothetical protein
VRYLSVMASVVILGVVALPTGGQTLRANGATTCGEERWAVKTLSDPREKLVNFKPKNTSVGRLGKKPAPHVGSSTPRIKGVETTTWRVKARLVEMKLEDDRDIHLVIAVPSAPAKTMIVEFPDTTCNGAASSPKKGAMGRARSSIIAACGQPSSNHFTDLSGRATVTGVGFFDIPHGQTGIAPNAIELHPVLKFSPASC